MDQWEFVASKNAKIPGHGLHYASRPRRRARPSTISDRLMNDYKEVYPAAIAAE
ncbi:hypothetical protein [Rhizobium sp. WYCCWR10014]|uniref:hypothetical protein n=1 Tax=Rhizobium sp. WYCCWR10014 TaxID=1825933 RepID=UPI000A3F17A9|nr:hypothetical protein [Rhizobium sp. WYCCWR10014]